MNKAIIGIVEPDSIGAKLGLMAGDAIIALNNEPIGDIIDYQLAIHDEHIALEVETSKGVVKTFNIQKGFDEDLGLSFDPVTIAPIRRCQNNCAFCFVSQMPPGLRSSLYVKDDDYRLSFLSGSYITGTNLTEADIDRICRLNLSPLYISVHRTDNERNRLMGFKGQFSILDVLNRLAANGISFHTQIVLCPGINDGAILERSISDLLNLWPRVLSLAVVPVGLTQFRKGLPEIKSFCKEIADEALSIINDLGDKMLTKVEERVVFASDELYLVAEKDIPSPDYYEGYSQLENGVGMARLFWEECQGAIANIKASKDPGPLTIATSHLGAVVIQKALQLIKRKFAHSDVSVVSIENRFFGKQVTVAGLITGSDLIHGLGCHDVTGQTILIPESMLRFGTQVFLDDVTMSDVAKHLNVNLCSVPVDGYNFVSAILGLQGGSMRCYRP